MLNATRTQKSPLTHVAVGIVRFCCDMEKSLSLYIIGVNYFKFHVSRKAYVTSLLSIFTSTEGNET